MSWVLEQIGFDESTHKHYEGAFTIGNGYMNIRGSLSEDLDGATQNDQYWRLPANVTLEKQRHPLSKWGVYLPGIYGQHPLLGEEMINLPYGLGLNIYCDGERFDMMTSKYQDSRRSLNMKNSSLTREVVWSVGRGKIKCQWEKCCSRVDKHLVIQRLVLTSDHDTKVKIENFIDADVTTNGYNHFTSIEPLERELGVVVETDTSQTVGVKACIAIDQKQLKQSEVKWHNRRASQDIDIALKEDTPVTIEKRIYYGASIDEAFSGDMKSHLIAIEANHIDNEVASHDALWNELWQRSDIEIKGNDRVQRAVRFSIYQLLRSANDNPKVAIDAKGYAGEAYYGHYFWDTEVYLLPFFIGTQPEMAKKLIEYRYETLKGARENAKNYGYKGARYPWESCISGKEQCSCWQYADLEVHVTADVIYGCIHYCENAGDDEFLYGKGLEMMMETARYWIDRTYKAGDAYHLRGVMGPDEYLPFTNNNTYTNYLVKYTLEKLVQLLESPTGSHRKLVERTTERVQWQDEELNKIKEIIEGIVLLIDEESSIIHQCEGFEQFEDIDMDSIWTDKSKPFGQFISQERNYRSKALKQADVVALIYLFREKFSKEMKKNSIDYYEPITSHDSSLSYIFHSLVYSDLGENDKAYDMFEKSLSIDLEELGAAEGIHIANCGGIWQGIVSGFAGVRNSLESEELKVQPALPKEIQEISFKIYHKKEWYEINLNHQQTNINKIK